MLADCAAPDPLLEVADPAAVLPVELPPVLPPVVPDALPGIRLPPDVVPDAAPDAPLPPILALVRMKRSLPPDVDELVEVDEPDVPVVPVADPPSRATHPTNVIVCALLF